MSDARNLVLFLRKMQNILSQPAPRIVEDEPSGLDAHLKIIDAYMVGNNGPRKALGGPLRGAAHRLGPHHGLKLAHHEPDAYFTPWYMVMFIALYQTVDCHMS